MQAGEHNPFCVPYMFIIGYTLIYPSLGFLSFRLSKTVLDTVDMSVSLPSDKLLELWFMAVG